MTVTQLPAALPPPPLRNPIPLAGLLVRYVVGSQVLTTGQLVITAALCIIGVLALAGSLLLAALSSGGRATVVPSADISALGHGAQPDQVSSVPSTSVESPSQVLEQELAPAQELPTSAGPHLQTPAGPLVDLRVSASQTAPPGIDSRNNPVRYDPSNVIDRQSDTAWRVPGDGVGESLTIDFSQPAILVEIHLIPGYDKIDPYDGTDRFYQNRRVKRVRFEFSDGTSQEGDLRDDRSLQMLQIRPVLTSSVRIVILETYEPLASQPRDFTPISEIVMIGGLPVNTP